MAQVRASAVVHADEAGWREDGHNGYAWAFSTPTHRYFLRRNRSKVVVDEALGDAASVLACDCYAACHHYDGPIQTAVHPALLGPPVPRQPYLPIRIASPKTLPNESGCLK